MGKIIEHVDNIPVYDGGYVYLNDWCKENGYGFQDNYYTDEEEESIKNEFYEWAENNNLTAQDC